MDIEWLKSQAKIQIQMWLDFINPKREIFRERLVKYIDQDKQEDKIWVNTIYSLMNLWIAIRQSDEANVIFMPRQFGDEEYADILTSLAKYDYDEMELSKLDYAKDWDSFFFWYALRSKAGWDSTKSVNLIKQEDPLTRIPDPYSDFMTQPRFHYFEKEMLKSTMTEDRWFDEQKVNQLTSEVMQELQTNKTYRNNASWLNDIIRDENEDFYISVYDWYTYYKGDLYMLTLDAWCREVLRAIKIEPVRAEEKKQGYVDIRTQVTVERFSPVRWNPCWISLVDLIIDKQTANSQLLNLRLIDAKFSTFWQMNLYDTNKIKNVQELKKPTINTKWIWVTPWTWWLSDAVYPVPRQSIMQDSYNVSNELSRQMQLETWMSDNTLWVAEKNITLWQAQQVQSNANIRLALWITVSNWWAKDFWNYIWLRWYEEYFWNSDVKLIRVANAFWVNVLEIRKDDFLWWSNPDITIESKKKVESDRKEQDIMFDTMLPYFIQDPSKATIVKNVALRQSLKLKWVSKELINILTYDKNEEWAKAKVIWINNNDPRGAIIDDITEDHLTYLVIFQSALDTPMKQKAIQARKEAYILSWQAMMQKSNPEWWMINQMQSQLNAQRIWQSKWVSSIADVSAWQWI